VPGACVAIGADEAALGSFDKGKRLV